MKLYWSRRATSAVSDYEVMRSICAELPNEEAFLPDYDVLTECCLDASKPLRILDFGAGMLRNSSGLLQLSNKWHVTAYDSSSMLDRGLRKFGDTLDISRLDFNTEWQELKATRFDAVIAILVFQHIEAAPLREILCSLTTMTKQLCVFGRRSLDDFAQQTWTPVWPIIMEFWQPIKVFNKNVAHPTESLLSRTRKSLHQGEPHDHCGAVFVPR